MKIWYKQLSNLVYWEYPCSQTSHELSSFAEHLDEFLCQFLALLLVPALRRLPYRTSLPNEKLFIVQSWDAQLIGVSLPGSSLIMRNVTTIAIQKLSRATTIVWKWYFCFMTATYKSYLADSSGCKWSPMFFRNLSAWRTECLYLCTILFSSFQRSPSSFSKYIIRCLLQIWWKRWVFDHSMKLINTILSRTAFLTFPVAKWSKAIHSGSSSLKLLERVSVKLRATCFKRPTRQLVTLYQLFCENKSRMKHIWSADCPSISKPPQP